MVGGFTEVHDDQLSALRKDDSFLRSEEVARKAYAKRNSGNLGQLVKVYQQVVAGMNYKLIFETNNEQVEIDVFAQPWSETYEVTNIQHVNQGVWFADGFISSL